MSVEKMNYYKEQKSRRKENLEKEKRRKKAVRAGWTAAGIVVAVGLCSAIGLTGYNAYRNMQAAKPDYSASAQVIEDMTGVLNLEEDLEDADLEVEEVEEEAEEAAEDVTEGAEEAEETAAETEAE